MPPVIAATLNDVGTNATYDQLVGHK